MLGNIVVDCSPMSNILRIGRKGKDGLLIEWQDREDEILNAVRDYMKEFIKADKNTAAIAWKQKDGKTVELRITIKDEQ